MSAAPDSSPDSAPVQREAWRFVQGRGNYVADVKLPGLRHVAFARSQQPHARILSIDASAAAALPGVVRVLTGADFERPIFIECASRYALPRRPVLPTDVARFEGEAVAAVVAVDAGTARDAARRVAVEYEPLPVVADAVRAAEPGSPRVHRDLPSNVVVLREYEEGQVDRAFQAAALTVKRSFRMNRGLGHPIEGRGLVAAPDPASDGLRLWHATQIPHMLRTELAKLLALPEHRIVVRLPDLGGGFGVKNGVEPEDVTVAWIAHRLGIPCRWLETLDEAVVSSTHGHDQRIDLECAVDAEGTITAVSGSILVDVGAYSQHPFTAAIEPMQGAGSLLGPYKVANYRCRAMAVLTNKATVGPLRGVARPSATFACERLIDETAAALGTDPLALRRRHVIQPADLPYRSATRLLYETGSFAEAFERLPVLLDYDRWRDEQARARADGRHIGIGIASALEFGGIGSKLPVAPGVSFRPGVEGVTIRVEPDGAVTVMAAIPSIGQNPESMIVEIVRRELGVRAADVSVVRDDPTSAPYSMGIFAGRGAAIVGSATAAAARSLRAKILSIAAHLTSRPADALGIDDGRIADGDGARMTLGELADVAYFHAHRLPEGVEPGLIVTQYHDPGFGVHSNSAHGVVVEVDPELFGVKLLRWAAVVDCGEILNETSLRGQLIGGVAYGTGIALTEQLLYDAEGYLVYPRGVHYYPMPRSVDAPEVAVELLRTPANTVAGAKPGGQIAVIAAPAAIGNAVADALRPFGIAVDELPMTPARLYRRMRR